MKVLSSSEADYWRSSHQMAQFDVAISQFTPNVLTYKIPYEASRKTALAVWISMNVSYPAILQFHEYGIWQEIWPVFDLMRKGLGETREIHEAPAHLFEEQEEEDLCAAVLAVGLYFSWGALLQEANDSRAWLFSHDDWVDIVAPEAKKRQQVQSLADGMKLKSMGKLT